MLARSTILLLTLGLAMSDTCQDICDSNPACAQSKFGSYCKSNGVCFGLYHQGCGYCFQPAEQETCDDSTLEPVACQGCQAACDTLPQCKNSDRGSYCKSWQTPPVCFGIIQKSDGSLCYHPTDKDCEGAPYPC
ncbi:hypothetical protein Pmar_PMAR023403 [Perkinsus marinus ATCC 50983]|uniref:Uncharacterized protein n=1 Tax=Perkinsus marinus (strain ATCC 50983 / TXsc) TaxID=423536 RepID=C5KKG6_PERM5|nr:hypothetical protein Pmar_PMAR023403 [Perkinsus marinus ATCC 50983]EER15078.1 hypothetical protein Pmar_PMAR023403 [Perkinsus marinus ATCC 50983]|eukprot:XP_002783282.1 hypothetical protein Pmar_PMAR023403 [Perkinsus marinus ATCC 50983]